MTDEHSGTDEPITFDSLGNHLRQTRIQMDLDLSEVVKETKISLINLTAIEDDDFNNLPPMAFARGLYTIYAKSLNLNPEEIVERLDEELANLKDKKRVKATPSMLIKEVSAMAERPAAPPTLLIGSMFIVVILIITLSCWYYSVNPATFLSERLRALNTTSNNPQTELIQEEETTVAVTEKYSVVGFFPEETVINVTIDDTIQNLYTVKAGEKQFWTASSSIDIELPENNPASLSLNGESITLPAAINGKVTISIPEILLD